jgi:predicted O-methyltransferase YrrM
VLQETAGACFSLGAAATRVAAATASGVALSFSGGDGGRSSVVTVECADVPRPQVVRVSETAPLTYVALIRARAGCALECARDEVTGAVCGGKASGVCVVEGDANKPARCDCASGFSSCGSSTDRARIKVVDDGDSVPPPDPNLNLRDLLVSLALGTTAFSTAVLFRSIGQHQHRARSFLSLSVAFAVGVALGSSLVQPQTAAHNAPAFVTSVQPLPTKIDLHSRWESIPFAREKVLATQESIWAVLGINTANKELREYGSSVSGQQIYYMLDARLASTVCEIGFYFGLGAANFLHANDRITYHGFEYDLRAELKDLFETEFGDRVHFHVGDSLETVPAFPGLCDIIHIDGNHGGEYPARDIANMREKAACNHLVFADDTFDCPKYPSSGECWGNCDACACSERGFCNEASQAWWAAVADGTVESLGCVWFGLSKGVWGTFPKGYCVGRYVAPPSCKR